MRKTILLIFSIFILLLISINSVFAVTSSFPDKQRLVRLPSEEIVNKDYFAGGEEVELSGTVKGDAYIAGGQIIVDGTIDGDLLVAGGNIVISGNVSQNVRATGGQISIQGTIGRNLTVAGGNVDIQDSTKIGGNLVAGAGNLTLRGEVKGDVTAGVGNLTLDGKVGKNVLGQVGQLRLTHLANVGGDLTYYSDAEADIDTKAKVAGELVRKTPIFDQRPSTEKIKQVIPQVKYGGKIFGFVSSLIVALLLVQIYPKYTTSAVVNLRKKPWASLGVGFLALFFTPLVVLFLLVTIIGIPLSLILLATYLIYVYLATIFFALWLGTVVAEKTGKKLAPGWIMVLGLLIYYLLLFIPYIRGLTCFFAILFGLGASLITCKQTYLDTRKKA